MSETWVSLLRITVGLYWLYFASTKWQSVDWVKGLIQSAGAANPIPGLHQFLIQVAAPNWFLFAVAQTIGETIVAFLLIVGLGTRWAAILGLLLAVSLALVVGFEVSDDGFRWLYYLAVVVNAQVIVSGPGKFAVSRFKWVPEFLR
ncbi:MAG: DoxX family membrane protein [Candidatus Dormibacteraceae bacterium]